MGKVWLSVPNRLLRLSKPCVASEEMDDCIAAHLDSVAGLTTALSGR